jgi:hypothetical protein
MACSSESDSTDSATVCTPRSPAMRTIEEMTARATRSLGAAPTSELSILK